MISPLTIKLGVHESKCARTFPAIEVSRPVLFAIKFCRVGRKMFERLSTRSETISSNRTEQAIPAAAIILWRRK